MGWPPPLTGAAGPGGPQEGATGGAAGPFERAESATLGELQRLILAMAALQRSADPESFAQVCSPPITATAATAALGVDWARFLAPLTAGSEAALRTVSHQTSS